MRYLPRRGSDREDVPDVDMVVEVQGLKVLGLETVVPGSRMFSLESASHSSSR